MINRCYKHPKCARVRHAADAHALQHINHSVNYIVNCLSIIHYDIHDRYLRVCLCVCVAQFFWHHSTHDDWQARYQKRSRTECRRRASAAAK